MIALRGLSKWYFNEERVLDQVSFELKRGEFLYLVGGSGAGKSSLLRILATEEKPSTGALSLFGYDLGRTSSSTLRTIRRATGYIPQDVRLIPDLTVFENVALPLELASGKSNARGLEARNAIDELLERLGIINRRNDLAQNLSGGEAQRVAIARALIRAPELILADEPTGAQDHEHTWSLVDLLLRANSGGATVVIATHDREIVRRVRKRCAVLKSGKVVLEDSVCTF